MPVLRVALLALLALLAGLVLAAPARAGDPIMPLDQVRKGMQCTAYSVLQGTTISSFGAEVVDVVVADEAFDAPRILVRFSGDAIERTGVGPGFSGSPIYCDGRVIGAISESVGEYGGLMALATPIEWILRQPVEPPTGTATAPPNARALATPISIAGLSPRVGRVFSAAARRGGRVLLAAPGQPRSETFPHQRLVPGASMAAGLSNGALTAGAVGTVTYVDGDRVWGFAHALDGAGRRSLFLQDAYVYAIVDNPLGMEGAGTYKLAAPGHDVGILSGDGLSAVAGRVGMLPDRFPMRVISADQDTGRQKVLNLRIADENALGLPTGTSALALVGSGTVAQAALSTLGSAPARQTGEMCARIQVRERRKPFRFCNRYVVRGSGASEDGMGVGSPMVTDFVQAVTAIDEYNFATLHVTGVEVNQKIRRGLRQAFLTEARGPDTMRRGRTYRLRVRVQAVRGAARWKTIRVRVPKGMPRGERTLVLEGAPADSPGALEIDLGAMLFGAPGESEQPDEAGPRTLSALAQAISSISRYDGVVASFQPPGDEPSLEEELGEAPEGAEGIARRERRVYRDPDQRVSGKVRIPVFVR